MFLLYKRHYDNEQFLIMRLIILFRRNHFSQEERHRALTTLFVLLT